MDTTYPEKAKNDNIQATNFKSTLNHNIEISNQKERRQYYYRLEF